MQLNKDQQNVVDEIANLISKSNSKKGNKGSYCLTGKAGCGKTVTTIAAIEQAVTEGSIVREDVAFCFPTNKLKNAFKKKIVPLGYPDTCCMTIYQLLKYFPTRIAEDVTVLSTLVESVEDIDPPYKVVVVDEAFCLVETLVDAILTIPQTFWLLSGDPGQLPPVGEKCSKLLSGVHKNYFSGVGHLTRIERQKEGGLQSLVAEVDRLGCKYNPEVTRADYILNTETIPAILNGEDVLVLAYTNHVVQRISKLVLNAIADKTGVPYECHEVFYPGASLIVKGLRQANKTVVPTNETVIVTAFDESTQEVTFLFDNFHYTFPIWTQELEDKAREKARDAETKALQNPNQKEAKRGKRNAWKEFDKFLASHVRATSSYVSTVHSSQGLTAENVYVHWTSIVKARENKDQLAYVAVSRASKTCKFIF